MSYWFHIVWIPQRHCWGEKLVPLLLGQKFRPCMDAIWLCYWGNFHGYFRKKSEILLFRRSYNPNYKYGLCNYILWYADYVDRRRAVLRASAIPGVLSRRCITEQRFASRLRCLCSSNVVQRTLRHHWQRAWRRQVLPDNAAFYIVLRFEVC